MEMGSRVSSKEKYCILAPRVDHLLQEENRHFKEEIRFLKEKTHKMDLDFRRESDKVQLREE